MYSVNSMYEAMVDGVIVEVTAGRSSRWAAMAAWWLGRQQILSARDFWYGVAAHMTNGLSAEEQQSIQDQLLSDEKAYLSTVTELPAIPAFVTSTIDGWVNVPVSDEVLKRRYQLAIQEMMNAKARERGYDSMTTAVTYSGDKNATFAAEAAALKDWRSDVWVYSLAELEKVIAKQRPIPTIADFLTELPAFSWPTTQSGEG
ncbi:hypothetical protein [Rhizobium paknamense]|uniref:Uncharacterized protein n=1 Tax=Rhizobium paknamense TaxID=1206817 RepID=A0ABU0I8V6_9HYPH|nr:hypothetical protein [Rhizobium paknamense]MDQ0454668.1 hypothetical protein [Rhizobium paknamense]